MRILCLFAKNQYGDPRRGESYELANFAPAFRRLGHDVEVFDTAQRLEFRDFADLNRALLKRVQAFQPDIVFTIPVMYEIWLETWQDIRASGSAALIHWACDDSWKYAQASRFLAPYFDAMATTDSPACARYRRDGFENAFLTQWAANADTLSPPALGAECSYGVSFVGAAHGDRAAYVEQARKAGVDIECFGHGWPAGPVTYRRLLDIIRDSVISLNFANSAYVRRGIRWERSLQLKARNFEVPGSGGFLLAQNVAGLERYYDLNREIAVFRNVAEMVDHARYFLSNTAQRDRRAVAAYERTTRCHTYDRRLEEVLEFALGRYRHRTSSERRTHSVDWSSFDTAVARHSVHPAMRAGARVAMWFCALIWGPTRGPRAARRITFEISWRLSGRHTYSSAGVPGRLFYRQS
ncbi:MAG: CgeB family protein [Candidatus Dormibacteria bacterium]